MTILVTSPEARDGKTTVAANLAAAYAQAGNRVLVVSCDLRRPAIHEMFGLAEEPGLTDALRAMDQSSDPASFDLTPYLKPCSILRVAVLPSGRVTDRPSEMLGSAAMQHLGERLKKITDVVILDCAPLVVAGDVVPLLDVADGVLLVARAGKTRRDVASSAATLLERYGLAEAGVVMNDAREFSIPLAKRRMYRPARKVRKAADATTLRPGDEDWVPEARRRASGRRRASSSDRVTPASSTNHAWPPSRTRSWRSPTCVEPISPPVEEGSRTRGSAPSKDIKSVAEGVEGASSGARRRPDRASRTHRRIRRPRSPSVSGRGPATKPRPSSFE